MDAERIIKEFNNSLGILSKWVIVFGTEFHMKGHKVMDNTFFTSPELVIGEDGTQSNQGLLNLQALSYNPIPVHDLCTVAAESYI